MKSFLLGDAIKFGWSATINNFGLILMVLVVMFGVQIAQSVVQGRTTLRRVSPEDFSGVTVKTDALFDSLMENGYINRDGIIQKKFYNLKSPDDLFVEYDFVDMKPGIAGVFYRSIETFPPAYIPLYIVYLVLWLVVSPIIQLGATKIYLSLVDDKKPEFIDLFSCPYLWFKFVVASMLNLLIIGGAPALLCLSGVFFSLPILIVIGIILLIFPGIMFSIKFGFFSFVLVDKNMGIIESLKKSSQITQGVKWQLLGLYTVSFFIVIAGVLCLIVGLLIAIPLTMIAYVWVYRQLFNQTGVENVEVVPQPIQ
ncbi:MAG: hypothetical protein K8S27_13580 [Candidatus Omnitrophica bacterium]|nr:hypothetical protein [Candidatus Omnitrophota bacterium]